VIDEVRQDVQARLDEVLASGKAMTASDVATATGLGRASVSTTLSKLAKSGEVHKAPRGYELTR
jgi:DNA-binding transcriptional regulator GbsR (MarR family)